MDVLTKEQRRRNMQAIKGRGTKIEIKLAKALWNRGIRYRKNNSSVFGKPDLTIRRCRIAIFVDSEYWHGKNWKQEKYRIKSNRKFWWNKIEGNIKRDKIVNKQLKKLGWKVLRFWGAEIDRKIQVCILKIQTELNKRSDGKVF